LDCNNFLYNLFFKYNTSFYIHNTQSTVLYEMHSGTLRQQLRKVNGPSQKPSIPGARRLHTQGQIFNSWLMCIKFIARRIAQYNETGHAPMADATANQVTHGCNWYIPFRSLFLTSRSFLSFADSTTLTVS
jgi:hypothetical protein